MPKFNFVSFMIQITPLAVALALLSNVIWHGHTYHSGSPLFNVVMIVVLLVVGFPLARSLAHELTGHS
jgi:hypothetical protein